MLHTESIPAVDGSHGRLLIILHGLGDTWRGWEWLPEALELPSLTCRFANAPDPYYEGFAWYDFFGDQALGIRKSRALLHSLLDQAALDGFPPEKIVMLGFSQGCVMTLDAGLRYPRPLAGLVGISGYVHDLEGTVREAPPHARSVPVLVTHGTQDTVVPIEPTRRQIQELVARGFPVAWKEYPKAHNVDFIREIPGIRAFVADCLKLPRQ